MLPQDRILNRLICTNCEYVFSKKIGFQLGNSCPNCNKGFLQKRTNDIPEIIDKRIKNYRMQTTNYYNALAIFPLIIYNTEHDIDQCFADYSLFFDH